ncbi:hypothetical protein UY3_00006 [Chelonia mydas]|uniref:Uncharacterized protein n=1 Tax=Chelonia mydas TaxID=8469 RepID=M7BZS2_CHEMY|nr:hypothetical protein UY3_00006 [Chelonia mydas]
MLKLYQPVVKQQEIKPEPSQASHMANLRQVTGVTSKQISEAMKLELELCVVEKL